MNEIDLADCEVIVEVLHGNKDKYREIVERYAPTLHSLAFRMTGSGDDAEDIVQQSFIKAYEHLASFDKKRKFFSWLYRIAINESLNYKKLDQKKSFLNESLMAGGDDLDKMIDEKDHEEIIQECISNMEPEYRSLIILKYLQEYSYSEIAEMTGLSEKRVKSRLYTARTILANILAGRRIFEE